MSKQKVIFIATAEVDSEEYGKNVFDNNEKIGMNEIFFDWLGKDAPCLTLDNLTILSEYIIVDDINKQKKIILCPEDNSELKYVKDLTNNIKIYRCKKCHYDYLIRDDKIIGTLKKTNENLY